MFDVERWTLDELIRPHPVPLPQEREKRAAPEGGQGVGTHSSAATSAVSKVQCSMFDVRCDLATLQNPRLKVRAFDWSLEWSADENWLWLNRDDAKMTTRFAGCPEPTFDGEPTGY
jgi:hypothetical protein